MYNQLLISLQIEEKWYTFRLFFGILSCYYLQTELLKIHIFSDLTKFLGIKQPTNTTNMRLSRWF